MGGSQEHQGLRWAEYGAELDRHGRTAEAERAFLASVEHGDFNGMYNLGLLAERAGRTADARCWYVRAHRAGHPEAANNLGVLLHNAGDPEAGAWFRIAAGQGHPQAAANLRLLTASRPPTGTPEPAVLHAEAETAYRLFMATGNDAALVRAVNLNREAARLAPAEHPRRTEMQADLRDILRCRYDLRGHLADLDEAVAVAQDVLSALPPGAPERLSATQAAIALLRIRSEATGDVDPLRSAVDIGRQALSQSGGPAHARAALESSLSAALCSLAFHTDTEVDLDETVALGRAAAERSGDVVSCINLGTALKLRGARRGSPDDLDGAVTALRAAVTAADSPEHRALAATNLAAALRNRAGLTGTSEDRREAHVAAEKAHDALRAAPADHPQTLIQAVYATGPADVDATRRAVAAVPPAHAARPVLLIHLAVALREAGQHDDAIEAAREAAATAVSGAVKVEAQRTLGRLLLAVDDNDARADAAVTEAVDAFTAAAAACEETDVVYAEVMTGLGGALIVRSLRDAADADRAAGLAAVRAAAHAAGSSAKDRLLATQIWAGVAWEAGDTADALEGARVAVSLLRDMGWTGLDRADQEKRLQGGAAMPRDAAALAIAAGQPELAVELLEQGRSVLWRSTLHLRGDLESLAVREPALAEELEEVRATLNDGRGLDAETRMRLARRWTRLLDRVRGMPGLATFLAPAPFDALAAAAAEGPVVIVNISTIRCDAILVLPGGRVDVVPLPGVDVPRMDAVTNTYLARLAEATAPGATGLTRERARHTVHDTLEWLWEHIARPVLDRLAWPPESTKPPRLWWCPTASLVPLPLHAAGRYPRTGTDPTKPSGLPYAVVSSYTTTLSALVDARRRQADPRPRLLAVALTDTQRGHAPLPGVAEELRALQDALGRKRLTVLADDAATVAAVRKRLPAHAWVHFACHGSLDMVSPATSGLCLRDGDLNVLDFKDLRLDRADLAFLSACHTRLGSGALPDEAIHTAAALRMAGFRHVVATLWAVSDRAAPAVAADFYRHLGALGGRDSADAAVALHHAVAALRDAHPTDPTLWAPFVHDGP
ncbi:CHAT domain-containing protein [Streptomyces sp. ISL-10]|uniref:CHAT domain-containing protein n=1 Tax=Streptomyces sp. ISL-10 TaxID=2819172 RepID=UPI001BE4FB77|nr:CHAT domain-containing protein [Streptomyces sp. ISL-10]MBT2365648.1 CHAT domain-containing protein [Streptomyces sp. ISL-10]